MINLEIFNSICSYCYFCAVIICSLYLKFKYQQVILSVVFSILLKFKLQLKVAKKVVKFITKLQPQPTAIQICHLTEIKNISLS